MFKKFVFFLVLSLVAGCVSKKTPVLWQSSSGVESERKATTVAVVLPLSGESAAVGESLKNAAMKAVFDNQDTPAKVLFFDTESTAEGAKQAYRWALAQRPTIVLGPVFSKEVAAIKEEGISVPLLTFTSDTTVVDDSVATMAVTVPEQVRQMVRHACQVGQRRLAVFGPESKTGEIAMNALAGEIKNCPEMTMTKVSLYPADTTNFTDVVAKVLPPVIDPKKPDLTEAEKEALARPMSERAGLDAIILFEEGIKLRQLLSILAFYDAGATDIPVYALTVVKQATDHNANGVLFADLDESNYQEFARDYKNVFGVAPLRIATQMYDAMGFIFNELAVGHPVSLSDLQERSGYWGMDGLVRLNPDGTNRRALLLKQKRAKHNAIIEKAEETFEEEKVSVFNPFSMTFPDLTTEPVD